MSLRSLKKNESKKSAKKRINNCAKGKRVERELVKFLKENGVEDAERTEQYNGRDGLSDVRSKRRLPMIHFESKGLKSKVIPMSTLKEWKKQIERDCPCGQLPIIFVKSNHAEWVTVMPYWVLPTILKNVMWFPQILPKERIDISGILTHTWSQVPALETLAMWGYTPLQCIVGIYSIGEHIFGAMMGTTAVKLLLRTFPSVCTASEPDPQSHESV